MDAHGQTQVGTSLTYQGELRASGAPAAGPVDLWFRLYDASAVVAGGTFATAGGVSASHIARWDGADW